MKRTILSTLLAAAFGLGAAGAQAQISDGIVKIGVMNDMSGVYADIGGPGSVLAAKMAVEAGYKNALPAILDANITTLIAAIVLFQFGTGPVQGFAVTLSIGIVASLFTALVLCRWIQEWLVNYQKIERISI